MATPESQYSAGRSAGLRAPFQHGGDRSYVVELPARNVDDEVVCLVVGRLRRIPFTPGLTTKTVGRTTRRACGRSRCYRLVADFGVLDRKPARRDEDGWALRPLLRSLGRHPVEARVNRNGYLDRLVLDAPGPLLNAPRPLRVRLRLSDFGQVAPVAYAVRTAIE